jgi:threonine synthase
MAAHEDAWPSRGMWRFGDVLPIEDARNIVTLGEGDTPVLTVTGATLGALPIAELLLKAEHHNPTGSFKDRIAATAASLVRERGMGGAVGTSSGNGGAAIAAYGARAGFPVVLFTVSGIVDGKLQQILAQGGRTHIVRQFGQPGGSTANIAHTIADMAAQAGWLAFLTGGNFAPEAMRGAETVADELVEQAPDADVVYVPVGGGGLLASIWRGYRRHRDTADCPRIVGVQPAGCRTLGRAIDGDFSALDGEVTTTISGLQVSILFDDEAAAAVRQSGGHVTEITDEESWCTQRILAREEGVFVEPAGATAVAGLLQDVAAGRVDPSTRAVAVMTGAGHKDPVSVARLAADNQATTIDVDELVGVMESFAIGRQRA